MSLQANFRAMAIATKLRERRPDGLLDICPANASYQVRFDPDVLEPADLESLLRGHRERGRRRARLLAGDAGRRGAGALRRPVDERDPDEVPRPPPGAGLDRPRVRGADQRLLAARTSSSRRTRARRGSRRWSASSPGCRSSTRWSRATRQLEVPKYVRPRTDTPALTIGHGGCFGCIYSVRGAGGYQMFGITPVPIYDPARGRGVLQGRRHREVPRRSRASEYDALRE